MKVTVELELTPYDGSNPSTIPDRLRALLQRGTIRDALAEVGLDILIFRVLPTED